MVPIFLGPRIFNSGYKSTRHDYTTGFITPNSQVRFPPLASYFLRSSLLCHIVRFHIFAYMQIKNIMSVFCNSKIDLNQNYKDGSLGNPAAPRSFNLISKYRQVWLQVPLVRSFHCSQVRFQPLPSSVFAYQVLHFYHHAYQSVVPAAIYLYNMQFPTATLSWGWLCVLVRCILTNNIPQPFVYMKPRPLELQAAARCTVLGRCHPTASYPVPIPYSCITFSWPFRWGVISISGL